MANSQDNDGPCLICEFNHIRDDVEHKSTDLHRFNFLLWQWQHYKKALVKDRHGIEVGVEHKENTDIGCFYTHKVGRGDHIIVATPSQFEQHNTKLTFECLVKNNSKKSVVVTSVYLIHPIELFRWYDEHLSNGLFVELAPGASYKFFVEYHNNPLTIGSLKNSLCINFQTKEENPQVFTIARNFCIYITEYSENESKEKSPFKDEDWGDVVICQPTKNLKHVNKYPIPPDYIIPLKYGLEWAGGMNPAVMNTINALQQHLRPGNASVHNYQYFFHIMLWLEEMGQMLMLRRYNMSNVTMEYKTSYLELEVPGLAEKRPSLINGDMIDIRLHEDHTAYRGIIRRVNDKTIEIAFVHDHLMVYLQNNPKTELDVRFLLGRLPLERQHEGIDRTFLVGMVSNLFPPSDIEPSMQNRQLADNEFYNIIILNNEEQKVAVSNIVYNTARNLPYIVFGPPGTGKTVTIVEAILQLKKKTNNRILVCAPANAACDMIATKLMQHCNKSELIRVHSESVDMSGINSYLREYSNIEGGAFTKTTPQMLNSYRIVVTTLILIGRYAEKYKPDVVFIDEAAQAPEPEADVAIGFLSGHKKQLVLAGDPKQLGPICCSKVSERFGFGKSLLERIMECEVYQRSDPNYITMLKLNFRCHPLILQIPNELFYMGQLVARSIAAENDPVGKHFVFPRNRNGQKNNRGQPIEFYSVIAKERREGRSPSYFNPAEIQMVMKYVNALLTSTRYNVQQSDIGIVTPYIRQVYKIKDRLRSSNYEDVEVGTTETFQGREKRILIISTVRAQHSLLKFDRKYNLGFVRNDKRFNVAVTRAMSKLIVIGCPLVLGKDSKWLQYIELCEELGAYFGAPYARRTENVMNEIVRNLNGIRQIDSQYSHQH